MQPAMELAVSEILSNFSSCKLILIKQTGRLGIGGTDSVAVPTLIESLQHVFIKKVAVNSGGKHCLALSSDSEVFSWGEGEDGKLGHNNRDSYDRPKLIESLSGLGIVDIACGSAHSAAVSGKIYFE